MPEITAALDEQGANDLLDTAIALIPVQTASGSGSLGPFVASYSATATLANGNVDLLPPDIIRIADLQVNWHLDLSFGIDLSSILPDFCLPVVCVDIPCVGRVCTPRICIDWPTITIPVSFGDFLKATADFRLKTALVSGQWRVEAIVVGIPNLQFGATTGLLLTAIAAAANLILGPIPFIGPFLAIALDAILAAIGIAGVTGFLGPIVTPFVSGTKIPIFQQSQVFSILPAQGPLDPPVNVTLDTVDALISHNGSEDELVLGVDISA